MTRALRFRRSLSPNQRGLAVIMSGTAGGQFVAILLSPVLTRLYSPTDFGTLATFTAVVTLLGVVSAGRYELAVPLPSGESQARSLVGLGLLLCGVTAGLGSVLAMGFADPLGRVLQTPGLAAWLWLAPLSSGAMGAYMVLNQWSIRQANFGAIGRRNLLQGVLTMGTQVVTGAAGIRPGGLPIGVAAGYVGGAISLATAAGFSRTDLRHDWSWRRLTATAAYYRRFPLYLSLAGVLNVAGLQVPILLLAALYGGSAAGFMGLTQRILAVPVTLLGTAVAQVYLSALALAVRESRDVRPLFVRTSKRLALLGLAGAVVLLVAGPELFALVFGAQWRVSGEFGQALALAVAGQFIGSPLSQTLVVMGHQRMQLLWDAGRFVATCGGVFVAHAVGFSPLGAVWVLGICSGGAYLLAWWLSFRCVRDLGSEP